MASIASSSDLQWYEIRDALLGQNSVKQDVVRAFELAAACPHPEARWLTNAVTGKDVKSKEEAREAFSALGESDARGLCFAGLLSGNVPRFRRSAELGYAFAQAWMAWRAEGQERFAFASQAAAQGERDGFYWLGSCYELRDGCQQDLDKAKENYLLAAALNHVDGMLAYASRLSQSDPQRWRWLGAAAAQGSTSTFFRNMSGMLNRFSWDSSLAPAVFAIGRALKGHVDNQTGKIFGERGDIDAANRAVEFFTRQCAAARCAVDVWCLIARRVDRLVNKDIRKKIGLIIWEAREQANYPLAIGGETPWS